jgi:hypothetical protein
MTGLTIKKPPSKALQQVPAPDRIQIPRLVPGAHRPGVPARILGRNKQQPDRFLDLNQGLIFYENLFFQYRFPNDCCIYYAEIIE